jgi:hypothetical protein
MLLFEQNNLKVRETRNIQLIYSGLYGFYTLHLQTTARNGATQSYTVNKIIHRNVYDMKHMQS